MVRLVTLLTDFGDVDGFVGAMRGVILNRDPTIQIADIAHGIPMGDYPKAGKVLARVAPLFPKGTVHCAVVDPGVGSERRPIAIECASHFFVGPDNGMFDEVLTALGHAYVARCITEPSLMRKPVSHTFHGRDVFAPCAAALAGGFPFAGVGPVIDQIVRLETSELKFSDGVIQGVVAEIDHFGNLLTNIPSSSFKGQYRIVIGELEMVGPSPSYSEVPVASFVVINGSSGFIEIACRDRSAEELLQVAPGQRVTCASLPDDGESES